MRCAEDCISDKSTKIRKADKDEGVRRSTRGMEKQIWREVVKVIRI